MLGFNSLSVAVALFTLFLRTNAGPLLAERWAPELPTCTNTTDFVYAGCFIDPSDPSALLFRTNINSQNMTVEICVDFCKGNGYKYAGLEYYGECFCGASVGGPQTVESNCSFPCTGNKNESCGGNDILSVYQDTTFPTVDTTTISDYSPMGCYSDLGPNGRTLAWKQDQIPNADLTIEACLHACKEGGYAFAGVEYSQECYCGVVLGNGTVKVNESNCQMTCNGNTTELCGGAANIYLYVAEDLLSTDPCNGNPGGPVVSSSSTSSYSSTSSASASSPASSTIETTITSTLSSSSSSYPSSSSDTSSTAATSIPYYSPPPYTPPPYTPPYSSAPASSSSYPSAPASSSSSDSSAPVSSSSSYSSPPTTPSSSYSSASASSSSSYSSAPASSSSSYSSAPTSSSSSYSSAPVSSAPASSSSSYSSAPASSSSSYSSAPASSSSSPASSSSSYSSPPTTSSSSYSSAPASSSSSYPSTPVSSPSPSYSSAPVSSAPASSSSSYSSAPASSSSSYSSAPASSSSSYSSAPVSSSSSYSSAPTSSSLSYFSPPASSSTSYSSAPASSSSSISSAYPSSTSSTSGPTSPESSSSTIYSTIPSTPSSSSTPQPPSTISTSSTISSAAPTSTTPISPPTTTESSSTYVSPTSSTTPSSPPTSSSSAKPSTTPIPSISSSAKPTTTASPTTPRTSSTLCTSTSNITPSPTCEYKVGNWCSNPLPPFSDQNSCFTASNTCLVQLASCFTSAGFPGSLQCLQFSTWCQHISSYCLSYCPGSSCSDTGYIAKYPPVGYTPPVISTITSIYTCPTTILTTLKPTPTPTTSTSSIAPLPTCSNICTQPHNPPQGYSSYSPVGSIPLPCYTCNNLQPEYSSGYPFKLYTAKSSEDSPSYQRPDCGSGCRDACDVQYEACVGTYAVGCSYGGGEGGGDSYESALTKCGLQKADCYVVNAEVGGEGRCGSFGVGY